MDGWAFQMQGLILGEMFQVKLGNSRALARVGLSLPDPSFLPMLRFPGNSDS